jgi:hypothetical protein
MIVWLASYPRSGSTLTRQVFRQIFGLRTHSRYNDRKDISLVPEVVDAVGHEPYVGEWPEFHERAAASDELFLVKTHEPPGDEGKAIYIVRDGRAAMVSFFHFLCEVRQRSDIDMPRVIEGRVPFGSWSNHLSAWNPLARPDTLLVRFEDLVAEPAAPAARIAEFLGIDQVAGWHNEIDRLRGVFPGFFRFGSNEKNIAELAAEHAELFWRMHGDWMRRLGYDP